MHQFSLTNNKISVVICGMVEDFFVQFSDRRRHHSSYTARDSPSSNNSSFNNSKYYMVVCEIIEKCCVQFDESCLHTTGVPINC